LLTLRQAGIRTLVQDEATSVVWGMPGTAFRLGAADEVLPLDKVAGRLLELARNA
jgi:two-component system chemotaxis response regulator CheB